MAGDGKINMPGSFGGLMRYDEEFGSKVMFSPVQVIFFIILVALFVLALKVFWPISVG